MTVEEIEVLLAMLEAVGASSVRATRLPVLPGSPPGTPETKIELEAAGKRELAFVHRELERARQFASALCQPSMRDRLDAMTALTAREARRGFDGLAHLLEEMALDLKHDVSNFATWPGIAQAFVPCVKALLEAAHYVPTIPKRSNRAAVEAAIFGEIRFAPGRFAGMSARAGSRWLAEKGLKFSGASLAKLTIWKEATRVGIGSPRRESSRD